MVEILIPHARVKEVVFFWFRRIKTVFAGLGIVWGAYRLSKIREYHADIREWEHEKHLAKAKEEARLKKWTAREETAGLMKV